jgi:hypothetical protein
MTLRADLFAMFPSVLPNRIRGESQAVVLMDFRQEGQNDVDPPCAMDRQTYNFAATKTSLRWVRGCESVQMQRQNKAECERAQARCMADLSLHYVP